MDVTGGHGRAASYIGLVAAAVVASFLLSGSAWQSDPGLHTLMEAVAVTLALATGSSAILRFYGSGSAKALYLGSGFLGAALLDLNHAVVTAPWFLDAAPSSPRVLTPWSWLASRLFLAAFMLLSWAAWHRERAGRPPLVRRSGVVYTVAAALTLASLALFSLVPLPAPVPIGRIIRPQELVPGLLLVVALVGYLREGEWRSSAVHHAVVLSLILGAVAQVLFMPFSGALYDGPFDAAHVLKICSYAVVFVGYQAELLQTLRREHATAVHLEREVERRTSQLRESEGRLRRVVESDMIGIVFWDAAGAITDANDEFLRLAGYSRDDLERGLVDWQRMTPPEYRAKDERSLAEMATRGVCAPFEKEYVRKDGTRVPVAIGAALLEGSADHGVAFILDLTELERARDEAARSHEETRQLSERLQLATGAAGIGVWEWDLQSGALLWDDRMYGLYGVEPDDFPRVYEAWEGRIHPDDRDRAVAEVQRAAAEGKGFHSEFRIVLPSGQVRHLEAHATVVRPDTEGGSGTMVGVNWDVTARRDAEQAVRTLNAELEERVHLRTRELEAVNEELEAFAYTVSHDLRAPLRQVDGFSRLLVEDHAAELSADAAALLQRAREAAIRMGRLIDELLEFSRLGRQAFQPRVLEPAQVVADVLRDLQGVVERTGARVTVEALPPCRADPTLLNMIYLNLLDNALKFSGTREQPSVEVGSSTMDGEQVYFVRDNGVGFDMRYADKLFGVFQRLHHRDEFPGTGVGLANVQRAVRRHHGRVWADSSLGHGTTFYFTIPGGPIP